jgi:hypothetical protein
MKKTIKKKVVTEKQLLDALEKYKEQLFESDKVSATKFDHYQTALYGARCIINDAFGTPRTMIHAWAK